MPEEDVMRFIAKNGEKVTLRLAGCQDAEEIISVIKTNAPDRSYVLMEHYGTKSEAVKKYICSMDFEKNLLLVAATERAVVGALSGIQMDGGKRPETSHILNIGLHMASEYRGMGIGSQMLNYAPCVSRLVVRLPVVRQIIVPTGRRAKREIPGEAQFLTAIEKPIRAGVTLSRMGV